MVYACRSLEFYSSSNLSFDIHSKFASYQTNLGYKIQISSLTRVNVYEVEERVNVYKRIIFR